MKKFDLELRVTTFGSVITWKIFLEDCTDDNQKVTGWESSSGGFLFKKLPGYEVKDNSLEVFGGSHGITGGSITCEVLINGTARSNKVLANVENNDFATQSYII